MVKVSVIIPVYNVEKYLSKCLDSVIGQTFKDIEIICVNDGSTDNSSKILETYQAKDDRMKVITQKNGGLFSARHSGMKLAEGEFILFVDSDDWIDPTLIEKAVENIEKSNAEVLIFGAYSVKNNTPTKGMYSTEKIPNSCKNKTVLLKDFEDNLFCFPPTAWTKLYRKKFLDDNTIRFQEIRNGEDQLFYLHMLLTAKSIYVLNENLYYYLKKRSGAITSKRKKTSASPIENFYNAEQLLDDLNFTDKYINQIINKYFNKSLSWYGKCAENFKDEFFENLLKLKTRIDNKYPNGWWKLFKLNKNDSYEIIKFKIFLAQLMFGLKKGVHA